MTSATPFKSTHPVDMFMAARDRLFIIEALVDVLVSYSRDEFMGHEEAAEALVGEAAVILLDLRLECEAAIQFLSPDQPEVAP